MANLIGRKQELAELHDLYNSNQAQFVAVYGRRRVGKTFLIDEAFKGKITFRHAGLSPIDDGGKRNLMKEQLKHFYYSLQLQGMKKSDCPTSWMEAFFMLEQFLESTDNGTRQIVFLDELPWMDTPRSNFISAFEGFWNTWGCHRDNLMLIVCGSANSWILNNLIDSHGGLYGRVTHELRLSPFTLSECELFYNSRGIKMSRYDMVQCYMILGGIPYYLSYLQKGKSLAQNIDELFYSNKPRLRDEFDRLLSSIFSNPDDMKRIIMLLNTRRRGFTRKEISEECDFGTGSSLSNMLSALIASDFVIKYQPFGKRKSEEHYKLIDPFCRFYLHFVQKRNSLDGNFWTNSQNSQNIVSWRGFAFEDVCFQHISRIKASLGIQGVLTTQSAWAVAGNDECAGCQIDLLISRKDNIVNMCEMKFYNDEFVVDKNYSQTIVRRLNVLSEMLPKRMAIHSTLITTFGLKYGEYSGSFQNVITMDDLFE